MRGLIKIFLVLFFAFTPVASLGSVTLQLQQYDLVEALELLAKTLHINVLFSAQVQGTVNLNLQKASPRATFDLLLVSNGLAQWKMGNVVLIAPKTELIKYKEENIKWRETLEDDMPASSMIWQVKYGKAEEIARFIRDDHTSLLSKKGIIRVDARTNIICIRDTQANLILLKRMLRSLDVPLPQILIEARLVSIDSDFEQELGIKFHSADRDNHPEPFRLAQLSLMHGGALDIKLTALEKSGHAELISTPSLFTTNGQPSFIESGEDIPYQEVSESGGTAIAFKKAVLSLKVTPQIFPGQQVLLHLQINQDRPGNHLIHGMPSISTRQIMTHAMVKSGNTIVLGGIYETGKENAEKQIPFIYRLPILGWLFRDQSIHRNKRELLIFVTPRIM